MFGRAPRDKESEIKKGKFIFKTSPWLEGNDVFWPIGVLNINWKEFFKFKTDQNRVHISNTTTKSEFQCGQAVTLGDRLSAGIHS